MAAAVLVGLVLYLLLIDLEDELMAKFADVQVQIDALNASVEALKARVDASIGLTPAEADQVVSALNTTKSAVDQILPQA